MQYKIIKHSNKMIFAFLGYGFLPQCLEHLELMDYGLCVFYDYRNLDLCYKFDCEEKFLFAFSMGVAVANELVHKIKFTKKVALNGTNAGIDENFGIKAEIFKANLENFDFENFKRLCFLQYLKQVKFDFNINAKDELKALYEHFSTKKYENNIIWDKLIISSKDYVFPNSALMQSKIAKKMYKVNAPHFALFSFNSWEQIFEI